MKINSSLEGCHDYNDKNGDEDGDDAQMSGKTEYHPPRVELRNNMGSIGFSTTSVRLKGSHQPVTMITLTRWDRILVGSGLPFPVTEVYPQHSYLCSSFSCPEGGQGKSLNVTQSARD